MTDDRIWTPLIYQIGDPRDAFAQLPALAKRLGVEPNPTNIGVKFKMQDGTPYDLFALINAFLDRVDGAALDKSPEK